MSDPVYDDILQKVRDLGGYDLNGRVDQSMQRVMREYGFEEHGEGHIEKGQAQDIGFWKETFSKYLNGTDETTQSLYEQANEKLGTGMGHYAQHSDKLKTVESLLSRIRSEDKNAYIDAKAGLILACEDTDFLKKVQQHSDLDPNLGIDFKVPLIESDVGFHNPSLDAYALVKAATVSAAEPESILTPAPNKNKYDSINQHVRDKLGIPQDDSKILDSEGSQAGHHPPLKNQQQQQSTTTQTQTPPAVEEPPPAQPVAEEGGLTPLQERYVSRNLEFLGYEGTQAEMLQAFCEKNDLTSVSACDESTWNALSDQVKDRQRELNASLEETDTLKYVKDGKRLVVDGLAGPRTQEADKVVETKATLLEIEDRYDNLEAKIEADRATDHHIYENFNTLSAGNIPQELSAKVDTAPALESNLDDSALKERAIKQIVKDVDEMGLNDRTRFLGDETNMKTLLDNAPDKVEKWLKHMGNGQRAALMADETRMGLLMDHMPDQVNKWLDKMKPHQHDHVMKADGVKNLVEQKNNTDISKPESILTPEKPITI